MLSSHVLLLHVSVCSFEVVMSEILERCW